jgi:hypothetical protein
MAFESEALRYRVLLMSAVMTERNKLLYGMPSGTAGITRLVNDVGFRYRGALLLGSPSRAGRPDIAGQVELLRSFGKPVVWFDPYDLPGAVKPEGGVFRCHFDENSGLRVALEHLHEAGHTRVGYAAVDAGGWIQERLRGLQAVASRHYPNMKILEPATSRPPKRPSLPTTEKQWSRVLAYLRKHDNAHVRRVAAEANRVHRKETGEGSLEGRLVAGDETFSPLINLVLFGGVVQSILHDTGVTALLCPNDGLARRMYWVCRQLGYAIPDDISLLSFDNDYTASSHIMSSVDFGFGHLGYCAFHLITKTLPIETTPGGRVGARAHVAVRGSVGPPNENRKSAGELNLGPPADR